MREAEIDLLPLQIALLRIDSVQGERSGRRERMEALAEKLRVKLPAEDTDTGKNRLR